MYGSQKDDDEESYQEFNKRNKNKKKLKQKKMLGKRSRNLDSDDETGNYERPVPPGVSVFDLIMPWKKEIIEQ